MDRFLVETQPSSSASKGKRKSDAADLSDDGDDYVEEVPKKPAAKKPRASTGGRAAKDIHTEAKSLVRTIVESPEKFDAQLVAIAKYAAALEMGETAGAPGTTIVKEKSDAQLHELADKLRKTLRSQVKKQMVWKPSCKQGGAKWAYEGVSPDPGAFQRLMNLSEPPKWKQTKITVAEFHEVVGDVLTVSIRYDELSISGGNVNVKWNKDTGEFRFAGTYGK